MAAQSSIVGTTPPQLSGVNQSVSAPAQLIWAAIAELLIAKKHRSAKIDTIFLDIFTPPNQF
jgi:uncharacterized membrane protein YjfL (UPF0719 family)